MSLCIDNKTLSGSLLKSDVIWDICQGALVFQKDASEDVVGLHNLDVVLQKI